MQVVWVWIARFLSGERFRKATPEERRFFSAYFLFVPLWGAFFVWFGITFMDTARAVSLWMCVTTFGVVLFFGSHYWGKFVPEKVSWILGGIIWAVVVCLALTGVLTL
ncbi:MAG: hypothetical protein DME23_06705 [Verrucomicrobia bacterium]|nr:MAG: hypothetical protein DME23_06705 [Verrucomicrobiota bacterium]